MAFRLAIVGAGRLGSSLAEGLLAAGYEPGDLVLVQHTPAARTALEERFAGVAVVAVLEDRDVDADTGVVLCVKPDYAEAVARGLGRLGVTRVLSVVAGLSTARLEAVFDGPVAVVRSMPNTPVLVRKGVSAIAGGAHVTKADLEWAESILGSVGCGARHRTPARGGDRSVRPDARLPLPRGRVAHRGRRAPGAVARGLARAGGSSFEGSAALLVATGLSPRSCAPR